MDRKFIVEMAYEIIEMDQEIKTLNREVKELREYKKQRQEQDAKYVNDSVNEIDNVLRAALK